MLSLLACGQGNNLSAIDETGNESASVVSPAPDEGTPSAPTDTTGGVEVTPSNSQKMLLNQEMPVRYK
ncbi:MAG: hypothetical protein J7501_09240, partial [Bdellovibrio sp.]|nr:hypothetical protein [Bdellovibrio sp.]